MKPMSDLKTECRNYEKILLRTKEGVLCFGFYEDGLIRVESTYDYTQITDWVEWMSVSELNLLLV